MHHQVSLNLRLVAAADARLPAVTGAALYGRGVFTVVAVERGRPFQWEAHWERLVEHARRARVGCEFGAAEARESLEGLIEANGVRRGRARVQLLARVGRGQWKVRGAEGPASDLLMLTADARPHGAEEPLALTVSPHRASSVSPLAGVKTINYLEQVMAWEEARGREFDEAVRLNERGEVVSAAMANLFWVTRGHVHTPTLQTGAVAGTTRAAVLRLAAEAGVPVVEGAYTLRDLTDAEEIFLTSASHGVALVTAFDFHRYTVPVGSVALRLHEAYRELTLR
ncbi:MAG TPA: aminotransferase class IV [Pyrinomonadaceae bacterium]|nr:aminotransferase class IV [Pyrinomonadaceae bacterium]